MDRVGEQVRRRHEARHRTVGDRADEDLQVAAMRASDPRQKGDEVSSLGRRVPDHRRGRLGCRSPGAKQSVGENLRVVSHGLLRQRDAVGRASVDVNPPRLRGDARVRGSYLRIPPASVRRLVRQEVRTAPHGEDQDCGHGNASKMRAALHQKVPRSPAAERSSHGSIATSLERSCALLVEALFWFDGVAMNPTIAAAAPTMVTAAPDMATTRQRS